MDLQQSSWKKCSEWLADDDVSIPKKVVENLLIIAEEHPRGLATEQLQDVYEARFGYDIDLASYGYNSLTKFIDDLSDVFRRVKSKSGYEKLFGAKQPVSQIEQKFSELGHLLDAMSTEVKNEIMKLLDNYDKILLDDFQDCYYDECYPTIDPTEYGFADMKELLSQLDGKLVFLFKTNGKVFVQKIPTQPEVEREMICDLFVLQKNVKRSDFPEGSVTPHDCLKYLQWNDECKVGDTVPIIVSQLRELESVPYLYFQLFKYKDKLDELTSAMNEFYLDCSDDWILPSHVAVSGMFCAAPFMTEGYNRVQIIGKMYNGMIKIFSVDFGEMSTIFPRKLRYLKSEFAKLPMLIAEGLLDGALNYDWYQQSFERLTELTFFGNVDKLRATFVENTTDKQQPCGYLYVFKLTCNGKDVIETLKEEKRICEKTTPRPVSVEAKSDPSSDEYFDVPSSISISGASHTAGSDTETDIMCPFPEIPSESWPCAEDYPTDLQESHTLSPSSSDTTTLLAHSANSYDVSQQWPHGMEQYSVPTVTPSPEMLYQQHYLSMPPLSTPFSDPMVPMNAGFCAVPTVDPHLGFQSNFPYMSCGMPSVPYYLTQQVTYPPSAFGGASVPPDFQPYHQANPSRTGISQEPWSDNGVVPPGKLKYSMPDLVEDLKMTERKSMVEEVQEGTLSSKMNVNATEFIPMKKEVAPVLEPKPQKAICVNGNHHPRRTSASTSNTLRRPGSKPEPNWNTKEDIVEVTVRGNKLHKIMLEGKPFFIMDEVLKVFPECMIVPGDERTFGVEVKEMDSTPSHIVEDLTRKNLISGANEELLILLSVHEFTRFFCATNENKSALYAVAVSSGDKIEPECKVQKWKTVARARMKYLHEYGA